MVRQKINDEVFHHGLSKDISHALLSEDRLKMALKKEVAKIKVQKAPTFKPSKVQFAMESPVDSLATS